jgi:hypothetical protein
LLPAGRFTSVDGRPASIAACSAWVCGSQQAQSVVALAAQQANPMVIDYEHQTLNSQQNGQPAPAAGWFKNLEWRDGQGLFATDVDWTPAAAKAIADRRSRILLHLAGFRVSPANGRGATAAHDGQTFGTATTAPSVNLLRIEESLSAAHLRLAGAHIENLAWIKCMERYDRPHTFFYCDPPYWQTEGYGVPFPFEEYERMATFMRSCKGKGKGKGKGKVMVSINDHPDIRRVFDGLHMLGLDIRYSVNNTNSGKVQTSRELVIRNWEPGTQNGGLF